MLNVIKITMMIRSNLKDFGRSICIFDFTNLIIAVFNFMTVKDWSLIFPNVLKANVGSSVMFHCASYAYTKWFHQDPYNDYVSHKSYFVLNSVSLGDNGFYYCFGEHIYPLKHFLAKAELKVYGEFC